MKILFFGNSLKSMINFRWQVIQYLANHGYEIFIVAPNDIDKNTHGEVIQNIHILPIDFCRKVKISIDVKTFFQYKSYIKKIKADIIFSYSVKPSLFSMLESWRQHNFYFITGLGSAFINKNYCFWIKPLLYSLKYIRRIFNKSYSDSFVFLNSDDRAYFVNNKLCLFNNSCVIPGEGIDLKFYRASHMVMNRSYVKFLFIGRLIKHKGVYELMEACRLLKKNGIKFECTWIGPLDDHNPSGRNMMFCQENLAQYNINYIGEVKDVRLHIKNHDVVVLPSYAEGISRVLLESMAIGRPIITTNVNGCRELVKHRYNGFIVKPKDVISLYDAMVSATKISREELKKLGIAGKEIVKRKYSIALVLNNYQTLISNISNRTQLMKGVSM
jgi:glycosyltransferase involved in cell wall biosynthesis